MATIASSSFTLDWDALPLEFRSMTISELLEASLPANDHECQTLAGTLQSLIHTSFSFGQTELLYPLKKFRARLVQSISELVQAITSTKVEPCHLAFQIGTVLTWPLANTTWSFCEHVSATGVQSSSDSRGHTGTATMSCTAYTWPWDSLLRLV